MNEIIKNNDNIYMYPLNGNNSYFLLNKTEKTIKPITNTSNFNNEFNLLNFWFQFDVNNFNTEQTIISLSGEINSASGLRIYKDTDNIIKVRVSTDLGGGQTYIKVNNLITATFNKLYCIILHRDTVGYKIVIMYDNIIYNTSVFRQTIINNNNIRFDNTNSNINNTSNFLSFNIFTRYIFGSNIGGITNIFNENSPNISNNIPGVSNFIVNHSINLLSQTTNMVGFISNINFIKLYYNNNITIDNKTLFNEIYNILYNNNIPKKLNNINKYNLGKLEFDFDKNIKINENLFIHKQNIDVINVNREQGTLDYNTYINRNKYFGTINNTSIDKRPMYFYDTNPDANLSNYIYPEMGNIVINNLLTGSTSTISNFNIKDKDNNTLLHNNINNITINNSNITDSTISGSVYNFIIRNIPANNPLWKLDYTFIPLDNNRVSPNFWFNNARLSDFVFEHTNQLGKLNIQYLSLSNNNFASTSKTTIKTLFHEKNNITFDNLYINNSIIRFDENINSSYSINTANINLNNNLRNSTGTYSFNNNHLTPIGNSAFTVNFSGNCTNFYWENNNLTKIEGQGVVDLNFVFTPVTQKQLGLFNVNNSNIRSLTLTSTRSDSTLINNSTTNGFNISNNLYNTGFTEFFNTLSLNNFNNLDQLNISNSGLYGSFDWNNYSIRQRFGNFNNANSTLNFGLNTFHRFISLPSARTLNFTTTNDYSLNNFKLETSQIDSRNYTGTTLSFSSNSCTFLNVDDNDIKERITFSSNVNNLSINNPDSNVLSFTGSPKYTYQLEFNQPNLLNLTTLDLSPKFPTNPIYNTCYFNGNLIFNNSLYSTSYNINTSNVGYNQYFLSGNTFLQNTVGLIIPQNITGNSINFIGSTGIHLNNLTGNTTLILNSSNSNLTGITFQTAGTCTITSFNISNTPILNLNIPSNNRISSGVFNAVNLPYINSNTGYTFPLGDIIQSLTINIGSTIQTSTFVLNNSSQLQNVFSGNTYYLNQQMEPIQVLNHLEKIYNNGVPYTGTGWQFGTSTVQTSVKTLNINTFKITNKALSSIPTGFTFNGSDGTFTTPNSPANILTRIGELRYVLTTQRASGGTSTNLRYRWFINL